LKPALSPILYKVTRKAFSLPENCIFEALAGSQGKPDTGNSRLTNFFMRFCGNFLPGVGFKVVRMDLKGQREAISSSWLSDDAVADSDPESHYK